MTANTAAHRADMKAFTDQLRELISTINALSMRLAAIDQWMKTIDKTVDSHEKLLHGNDGEGVKLQVERLNNRVNMVFAVGAGAWALFTIAFAVIAANLFERLQMVGLIP